MLPFIAYAGETSYASLHEVARWQVLRTAGKSDLRAAMVRDHPALAKADPFWEVLLEKGRVVARLKRDPSPPPRFRSFLLRPATIVTEEVEDGWLLSQNRGEWGGTVFWVSRDGSRRQEISRHQVRAFFRRKGSLYAAEGLSHLDESVGSIVRFKRSGEDGSWKSIPVRDLPSAPEALTVRRDGSVVLVLTDSIVLLGSNDRVVTLLPKLRSFGATSCVVAPGTTRLYIGMRYFVAEFELASRRVRYLVPPDSHFPRLSRWEIEKVRRRYRTGWF